MVSRTFILKSKYVLMKLKHLSLLLAPLAVAVCTQSQLHTQHVSLTFFEHFLLTVIKLQKMLQSAIRWM